MKIVLAAQQLQEISAATEFLRNQAQQLKPFHFKLKNLEVQILITGSGLIRTTYVLSRYFQHQTVNLLIHSGLAIPLNENCRNGDVFQLTEELLFQPEFQNNTPSQFQFFPSGETDEYPFNEGILSNPQVGKFLPAVRGVTCDYPAISDDLINAIIRIQPEAQLLSADNSAVFFVALMEKVNFLSIRSSLEFNKNSGVSAVKKNEAIANLNKTLIEIILSLSE